MSAAPDVHVQGAPVRVVELVKDYNAVRAVDGVSLDVGAGEFLALLGPSGSGKTTVLMTIAGFEQPTSGAVRIGDRDITYVPPNKRNVGMVFQRYALFPHMSVFDNIAFPLRMRKVAKAELTARVETALDLVRLAGYAGRRPDQLSGGQQQRVALARAIVFQPAVLLMDEPLGALDRKLRQQLQLELKRLQRQLGATVVYVTHDQDEALTMADRIGVMNDGRLEQIGTPQDLYERPANAFVADFVGEMNFLPGTLRSRNGVSGVVALDRGPHVPVALHGHTHGEFGEGRAVQVAVRPERIAVHEPASDRPASLQAVVEEVVYGGGSISCQLRLVGEVRVTARVPAASWRWRAGDKVSAAWDPEHVHVYSADRP